MASKFVLFAILTFLVGNPLVAILLILVLYSVLDFRYFGVSHFVFHRMRTGAEIRELQRDVILNPHNASALNDLGRLLVLDKRYREALPYLERAIERLEDTDETNYYLGLAHLMTGNQKIGEERIFKAVELNPRLRYGEPYLRLGEYYLQQGQFERSLAMLRKFHEIHTSSAEGFYYQGEVYQKLGETDKARESYQKAIGFFQNAPSYKKREDRKWAWRSRVALGLLR